MRERDLIVRVVGERWKRALVRVAREGHCSDFGVLARRTARRWALDSTFVACGCWSYVAAQLLAQIPITPGGLGFVEAGLTGFLALAGVVGR